MNKSGIIRKYIMLCAFAAIILNLSLSGIISFSDCLDNCMCCCKDEQTFEIVYTDCCSSKVVIVSKDCCQKEHSHEAHLTASKYNFRGVISDLREFAFNRHILAEISGIGFADKKTPVDIVYFIFKPPIV